MNLMCVFFGFIWSAMAIPAAAENPKEPLDCEELEDLVVAGLDELSSIQGVSLAIYTPESQCVAGFGVTDIDTQEEVTADTAFYIASSTKSMFALALAAMDSRGELDLDQPISEFAPSAPFSRRIPTDRITLRHLLAMSSGIKNPAYVHRTAYSGEYTDDQLWDLIGSTQRNRSRSIRFGKFRYTNWNYNLAAKLVERQRSVPWQDMLVKEIFDKLGMSRTTAYISRAAEEGWPLARPHATLEPGGTVRSYLEKTDATMHAAGGVIMSGNDALKLLEVFVEEGSLNGEQIFPSGVVQSTRQRLTEADTEFNGYEREHYGLGWYIGPYRDTDVELVHHFGGFSGARAHVSYMPDQEIGVAVFVNDSAVGFKYADVLANYVYDRFLGLAEAKSRYLDEIAEIKSWAADIRVRLQAQREEIAARPSLLSQPLTAYVGTYADKGFGTVDITLEDGRLRVTNGQLSAIAQSGNEAESIRVELVPLEGANISFGVSRSGEVRNLKYQGLEFDRQSD
ncbi:serine hydrolase [Erythrobacter sp. GH1-10]|uniref:serine hydrolase n=1 Tax=Erythrobacter sp. GH1-10 TaxID=3349334 RepID=UPI003878033C